MADSSLRLRPWVSLILFISAYSPLMVIMAIKQIDLTSPNYFNSPEIGIGLLVAAIISSVIVLQVVTRNLKYMRAFAEAWLDFEIVQQLVAQLPWGHNVLLLNRIKTEEARLFYTQKALAESWSRTTLEIHIKNRLYERQGQAVTNFAARLPAPSSALAQETLKDPYLFDFLSLGEDAQEREIENALVQHITRFLLDLGIGQRLCLCWTAVSFGSERR